MKADELRKKFLAFFESKGHTIVPSDSLVPREDPTLLFTSAGMNQFKNQFMGRNITYRRAATCQKCLRTADLDKVGKTPYHHTFFEMLGNFSFGDYFKKETIIWAWEFMTEVLKIPEANLWISVYKYDDEAYNLWKDTIKIPENKIIRLGDKENFWPSNAKKEGPNGPCGPCAEIFYDWGETVGCKKRDCNPACDCGRFVEVWNLVFTQFNRVGVDQLEPLSAKNIDTGMGLERLASVMQGVHTNFEIDFFKPIIEAIEKLLKFEIRNSKFEIKYTIYAIADHIRAISFAILDGVMPSNEGKGYVIRKLIRISSLHGISLGLEEPFLYKLPFSVAKAMEEAYPEIGRRHEDIAGVIKSEEEFFRRNLDMNRANMLYDEKFKEFSPSSEEGITLSSGKTASFLNDTYGIPPELTRQLAKEKNHIYDEALWQGAYEESMEKLRELSRKKSTFYKDSIFAQTAASKFISALKKTEFVGYRTTIAKAKIIKIFKGKNETTELKEKSDLQVVLDRTPFYAEAGGQVGDSGTLKGKDFIINIIDTKSIGDVIVHIGKLIEGKVKVGEDLEAEVDKDRRESIIKNHTATHLLQNGLRKVLGEHVHQAGSVVDENRLRFDFTHSQKLSPRELERAEEIVNENIQNSDAVKIEDGTELKKAIDQGALALFGEKYGARVRVVTVGDYSKELCGGTHVGKTSEIKLFKIISEGSVAAGVRRIEAITDKAVEVYVIEEEKSMINQLNEVISFIEDGLSGLNKDAEIKPKASDMLKKAKGIKPNLKRPISFDEYVKWEKDTKPKLKELIETLQNLRAKLEKEVFSSTLERTKILTDEIMKDARKVGGSVIVVREIKEAAPKVLRFLADEIKSKIKSGVVVLATKGEGKISFVCAVTPDLVKKGLHAGNIANNMAAITSGGGGGKEDFALAGGKDTSKLKEALDYVYKITEEELKK